MCAAMEKHDKHKISCFTHMKELFDKKLFCDLQLKTEDGTRVAVHRNVMYASSKHFAALLASGTTEMPVDQITMPGINGDTLAMLIDYCYTGDLKINERNVERLLLAASRFQFEEIVQECSTFLNEHLEENPLMCITYYTLAYFYNLTELKNTAKELICRYFMKISTTEDFLSLSLNQLLELIKSDLITCHQEEDVYKAVMQWIKMNSSAGPVQTKALFNVIRFTNMSIPYLTDTILDVFHTLGLEQLYKDIIKYKFDLSTQLELGEMPLQPRIGTKLTTPSEPLLFFITKKEGCFLHREQYMHNNELWNNLEPLKLPFRGAVQALVTTTTSIFVFGPNGELAFVSKIATNLLELPKMPSPRVGFAAVHFDGCIYVIGGNVIGNYDLPACAVDRYEIQTRRWTSHSKLSINNKWPVATAVKNKIFCGNSKLNTPLEICDLKQANRRWTIGNFIGPIQQFIVIKEQLYVQSGKTISKYDFLRKKWESLHEFGNEQLPNNISTDCGIYRLIFQIDAKKKRLHFMKKFCLQRKKWIDYNVLDGTYEDIDMYSEEHRLFVVADK